MASPVTSARHPPDPAGSMLEGITFDTLLQLAQRRYGSSPAIRTLAVESDLAAGPARQNLILSFDQLEIRIGHMAALLRQIGVQQGQRLAVMAPLGADSIVALLAGIRAGCEPVLIPVDCPDNVLARLLEHSAIEVAIGVDHFAGYSPLLALRSAAAKVFGLRCIAGFGTDIPDGVVPLEQVLASLDMLTPGTHEQTVAARHFGLFEQQTGHVVAGGLAEAKVLEMALDVVQALQIAPGARIVSTLLGGHLAALATGPAAALMTGASYQPLGLFSRAALAASLSGIEPVHLVLPGNMEKAFSQSSLNSHPSLTSVVFVHHGIADAPTHLPGHLTVIDVNPGAGHPRVTRR